MADKTDLERLIKLLKMTTAAEDTVCLVAIRKANEEVGKLGSDWESILRGKVTIIEDPFKNAPQPTSQQVKGFNPFASKPAAPRAPSPPPRPQAAPQPSKPYYGQKRWNSVKDITEIWDGNYWVPERTQAPQKKAPPFGSRPRKPPYQDPNDPYFYQPSNKVVPPKGRTKDNKWINTGKIRRDPSLTLDDALDDLMNPKSWKV